MDLETMELARHLSRMIGRLESLIRRTNDAMTAMQSCPNCRHDVAGVRDGMGCIGTDLATAKRALAQVQAKASCPDEEDHDGECMYVKRWGLH